MLRLTLCLSLLLSPALALKAEENAVSPSAQASAVAGTPTAEAVAEPMTPTAQAEGSVDASAVAPEPPKLPDAGLDGPAPEAAAGNAEIAMPKEAAVAPLQPVAELKPSRFRFGNFALGFLGGALLGGAYGVLSSGGKPGSEMAQNAGIYGGAAGVVLGLAGLLLGATSPEEARPPRVDAALPAGTLLALSF